MAGPHIIPTPEYMWPGRRIGMGPNGMPGMRRIQPTGNIFINTILIGAATKLAIIMTRLSITATTAAWVGVGEAKAAPSMENLT